jgi:hypothetical protein
VRIQFASNSDFKIKSKCLHLPPAAWSPGPKHEQGSSPLELCLRPLWRISFVNSAIGQSTQSRADSKASSQSDKILLHIGSSLSTLRRFTFPLDAAASVLSHQVEKQNLQDRLTDAVTKYGRNNSGVCTRRDMPGVRRSRGSGIKVRAVYPLIMLNSAMELWALLRKSTRIMATTMDE